MLSFLYHMCPGRSKKNPDIASPRILITLLPQADHTDPITSQLERAAAQDTSLFSHLSPLYQPFERSHCLPEKADNLIEVSCISGDCKKPSARSQSAVNIIRCGFVPL